MLHGATEIGEGCNIIHEQRSDFGSMAQGCPDIHAFVPFSCHFFPNQEVSQQPVFFTKTLCATPSISAVYRSVAGDMNKSSNSWGA